MKQILCMNFLTLRSLLSKFIIIFPSFLFWNILINSTNAYPIYAQQAYENPREPNGRIVCANCHLAQKPVIFEAPKAVIPNQIFETIIKIPYNLKEKQILGDGKLGNLNVGAVMILPDGFRLANKSELSEELKEKLKKTYITAYSKTKENILVVGPVPGEKYQEITFPLVTPNPEIDKKISYVKYPIYVGGNRGRGQVYPTGEKTNNNLYSAEYAGKIESINTTEKGDYNINILTKDGIIKSQKIPKGINLIVSKNQIIQKDQNLTNNPNVGGFGQTESEIVLQNPTRIISFLIFCLSTIITQTFFVLKKKQFEKVQSAEFEKI